jgi:hypothetical protein
MGPELRLSLGDAFTRGAFVCPVRLWRTVAHGKKRESEASGQFWPRAARMGPELRLRWRGGVFGAAFTVAIERRRSRFVWTGGVSWAAFTVAIERVVFGWCPHAGVPASRDKTKRRQAAAVHIPENMVQARKKGALWSERPVVVARRTRPYRVRTRILRFG